MSKAQPIDVRDMAIVHRTFRKAYDEAARLVRAAPTPSPGRVTFLADHIDLALAALHIHHEDEDALLAVLTAEAETPLERRLSQVIMRGGLGQNPNPLRSGPVRRSWPREKQPTTSCWYSTAWSRLRSAAPP